MDRAEFDRWREAAADAGRAAAIQRTAAMYNWACFLSEQSAQLAVKGLLHGIGRGAWGHDLVALGERLREAFETDLPDADADLLISYVDEVWKHLLAEDGSEAEDGNGR